MSTQCDCEEKELTHFHAGQTSWGGLRPLLHSNRTMAGRLLSVLTRGSGSPRRSVESDGLIAPQEWWEERVEEGGQGKVEPSLCDIGVSKTQAQVQCETGRLKAIPKWTAESGPGLEVGCGAGVTGTE